MSEDSPKIVSLETSLELSAFPSEADRSPEADNLSEADFPSEADLPSRALSLSRAESPSGENSASGAGARIEPAPFISAPIEKTAVVSAMDAPDEPVWVSAHVGPATVTDFPVRPQMPAAVAVPSLTPGPITLVELIERRGGFDWREAVAVIHQVCLYLTEHAPHSPILLDPRNIQITDKGEVRLLSGQTSSDPLVIQVGRLLRTMLVGKEAPPELRLLLSQATFELPIFESIEDVDRALAQLNNLDEPGPAGLALLRAMAAPPPPPNGDEVSHRPPPIRSILPTQRGMGRRPRSRAHRGALFGSYSSHVAIIFVAILVVGGLLATRPAFIFSTGAVTTDSPLPATARAAPVEIVTPAPAAPERPRAEPTALVPSEPAPAPPSVRRPPPVVQIPPGVVTTPLDGRTTPVDPSRRASNTPRPAATVGIMAPPSPRDSQRRATSLLAQGQLAEASMAFDSLVSSNPFYEPRTSDLTPEALAAFRASQRLLLPVVAQRNYERAKAALDAGDADRSLALAKETMAIIDRRLADTPAELRAQVADLIEQAATIAATANEIIYTEADLDVIPPRPLSRQMPVTGPIGVPPNRVGWLEMLIGRDGSVAFVKLHTPLNRHHERMIVSPAKAWRYRPAMRNGKPVMYRIMVKVNLPESGTDF
jgi:hypothetical protein